MPASPSSFITPADGASGDWFGHAVATSANGRTVVLGGLGDDISGNDGEGSARVFDWNGTAWVQRGGPLRPADIAAGDTFGFSVAVSDNGNTVVLGGPDDDVGSGLNQGSARVFDWDGTAWVQRGGALTPGDGATSDAFGRAVAVSAEGSTVIVGGPGDEVGGNFQQGSARVFAWDGTAWQQRGGMLTASDGGVLDNLGASVAVSEDGGTVVIGGWRDNVGANNDQGSALVFVWDGAAWQQRGGVLTPSDGQAGENFGRSVAVAANGNTVVLGGPGDSVDGNIAQGSARVFDWNGAEWVQRGGPLTASDGMPLDQFGFAVAASEDGNTVVITGALADVGGNSDQGSARVFDWNGAEWVQRGGALTASDGAPFDYFGWSVAIAEDGNTVVVGNYLDDVGTSTDQGSARVFTWDGSAWVEGIAPATLTIAALSADKLERDSGLTPFTFTVTRSGDTAGSASVDFVVTGLDASSFDFVSPGLGTVVFAAGETTKTITIDVIGDTQIEGNESFSVTLSNAIGATLGAEDRAFGVIQNDDAPAGGPGAVFAPDGSLGDLFGWSVALTANGRTMVVGAPGDDVGSAGFEDQGSASVFDWNGSTWVRRGDAIFGADWGFEDRAGSSVAISDDGNVIVIGAPNDNVAGTIDLGSARVFAWNGTAWEQRGGPLSAPTDNFPAEYGNYGQATALSADGSIVAVAAPFEDVDVNGDQGGVRVFAWNGTAWEQRGGLVTPVDGAEGDLFGWSVSLSSDGNTMLVGSLLDDVGGAGNEGSARVFTWNGTGWEQRGSLLRQADGQPVDQFGRTVALSADGNSLIVGSSLDAVNGNWDQGSASVFVWNGTDWAQRGGLLTLGDGEAYDLAASSVAISDDGNTVVLGVHLDDVNGTIDQGSARVFTWNGTAWEQRGGPLTPTDGAQSDGFGNSVSVSADGNTVAVGGPYDDVGLAGDEGSVRVFTWNGTAWVAGGPATATTLTLAALSADKAEGDSGLTDFTFTLTRTGSLAGSVSVDWFLSDIEAVTGVDLAMPASGTLFFLDGQATQTLTIQVVGDTQVEGDESFTVTLTNAIGATLGATTTATGTIRNDDAEFTLAALSADKAEGDSGSTAFTFTITRSGNLTGAAFVEYMVTGVDASSSDFVSMGPVVVAFADGEATKTITVDVVGDTQVEGDETFTVTLTGVAGAEFGATITATGIIRNDDVAVPGITLVGLNWWGDNHLVGTEGPDHLTAPGWRNSVLALGGDDTIYGGLGNSFIDAGAGNDKVDVEGWGNIVFGGTGDDTIYAGQGNSFVDAGTGHDKVDVLGYGNTVLAGAGNDTVYGGQGNSFVDAGAGDDKVDIDGHGNSILAGAGNDTVFAGAGNSFVDAGEGDDKVDVLGNGNSILAGGGNDTIYAGTGNSFVDAGLGDDEVNVDGLGNGILAGGGNDTVYAGQGGAYVEGGEGDDRLTADGFGNTLLGGAGADVLFGGAGTATLWGGEGNDTLMATGWSNIFVGGAGDDVMQGGAGGEQFWLNAPGAGVDRVLGFDAFWGDRLVLQGVLAEQVTAAADGADLALAVNGQRVAVLVGLGGLSLAELTGQGAMVFV